MTIKKAIPLLMLLAALLACQVERIPDPTFQSQQEEFQTPYAGTLTATYAPATIQPPGSDSPTPTLESTASLIAPSSTYTESPIPTVTIEPTPTKLTATWMP